MLEFEELEAINPELVYIGDEPEQYREAILGLTDDDQHLVYSYDKLRELMLKENPEWSDTDADEWIEVNTRRACQFMGENNPIIINDIS